MVFFGGGAVVFLYFTIYSFLKLTFLKPMYILKLKVKINAGEGYKGKATIRVEINRFFPFQKN